MTAFLAKELFAAMPTAPTGPAKDRERIPYSSNPRGTSDVGPRCRNI